MALLTIEDSIICKENLFYFTVFVPCNNCKNSRICNNKSQL